MRESFDKAFELVVGLEGGYSNDPRDPGGETKFGISKRYHPELDIANLALEQAKSIYLNGYWIPAKCDESLYPLDICLFDGAVNPQNDPGLAGSGNTEIMAQMTDKTDWKDFLLLRAIRYMKNSKRVYVLGHLCRIIRLYEALRCQPM